MSRIRIRNFGPIKEGFLVNDGWMDIKKVTIFIGNQGSGKSTIAKVVSTMSWIEKALFRGDINEKNITFHSFTVFFYYQGLKNYFRKDTLLEYEGEEYNIGYSNQAQFPIIKSNHSKTYLLPRIMYIPAERNFLSVIKDAFDVTGLPAPLRTFGEEIKRAQKKISGETLSLPINNYEYSYDEELDSSYIIGPDHKINLLEASSGFQSAVPLFLVSRNLSSFETDLDNPYNDNVSISQIIRRNEEIAKFVNNHNLSAEDMRKGIEFINLKYQTRCFINIVEEPEQNLFPFSQWEILKKLLEYNNLNTSNKLIITSHSPYIINYLTIAIQGAYLFNKITTLNKFDLTEKLNRLVPINSLVSIDNSVIYELDEQNGIVNKLSDIEGIPSDKNYLNSSLAHGNQMFDSLLEIEQEL